MADKHRSPWLDPAVADYVARLAPAPDQVVLDLVAETERKVAERAGMQVSVDQAALLGLLVGITGARRVVEVGTFTGLSALAMARALPEDGQLLAYDVSEEWTAIARRAWARAGVSDRIDLRIAPALDTLRALPDGEWIDLAFVDADKGNYAAYADELLARMRPNGLLCVDNTLWGGSVVTDPHEGERPDTDALRRFNEALAADDRVDAYILPVADGLTLARKR